MPIPFILGGIALAAGAYGAKKGVDAYDDYSEAKEYNERAQRIYDKATERLNDMREQTNTGLENLGVLKASIYEGSLNDFVSTFSKIKNVDFEDNLDIGTRVDFSYSAMLEIKESVVKFHEVMGGGIAALGSGTAAGFGAFGGVGLLATASTGTAISSLSGVAATNATLAWLGGGSLATGGFGMAGGMAVLGGIVAGPVLAVGGMMLAAKAEEAKHNARRNLHKAKAAAEEMDTAIVVLKGMNSRVEEFDDVLRELNDMFEDNLADLKTIVLEETDYSRYSDREKQTVMITASIAQTIKNVCDTPIIDEDGAVTVKSKEVLRRARAFVSQIEAV